MKRESERRQRDRDRSGNIGIPVANGTAGGKRVTVAEGGDIGIPQYPVEVRLPGQIVSKDFLKLILCDFIFYMNCTRCGSQFYVCVFACLNFSVMMLGGKMYYFTSDANIRHFLEVLL